MLSATADSALRAVLILARAHGGAPVPAHEIARMTGAPANYLAKTLNALAKAGIVTSARGPQGGFTLATAPDALTLADVVDCFEGPRPSPRCLLGAGPCDPAHPCAAHDAWTAVLHARRTPLATTTFADLLGTPDTDAVSPAASAAA
jgi:Rrf2 family protein